MTEAKKAAEATVGQPKTTTAGLLALGAVLFPALKAQFDNDPLTVADWTTVAALVPVVIGLFLAKDGDK